MTAELPSEPNDHVVCLLCGHLIPVGPGTESAMVDHIDTAHADDPRLVEAANAERGDQPADTQAATQVEGAGEERPASATSSDGGEAAYTGTGGAGGEHEDAAADSLGSDPDTSVSDDTNYDDTNDDDTDDINAADDDTGTVNTADDDAGDLTGGDAPGAIDTGGRSQSDDAGTDDTGSRAARGRTGEHSAGRGRTGPAEPGRSPAGSSAAPAPWSTHSTLPGRTGPGQGNQDGAGAPPKPSAPPSGTAQRLAKAALNPDAGESRLDSMLDEGTRAAAAAGISAATGGAVPVAVAGKAIEAAEKTALGKAAVSAPRKIIKVALGIMLVLAFALISMFVTTSDTTDPGDIYAVDAAADLDIPAPYLEAYQEAGRAFDVPWTLIAAVGARATYHGRVNPYVRDVPNPTGRAGGGGTATSLYVLGDSLSVGTEGPLEQLGTTNNVDVTTVATVGIRAGQQTADAYADNPAPAGAAVVIALGTNNLNEDPNSFAKNIDKVMNAVGSSPTVYWLTVDVRDPANLAAGTTQAPLNEEIRVAQNRWPNLRVADWAAYAADNGIDPGSDGIHLDSSGYTARAEYIFDLLQRPGTASVAPVVLEGEGVMEVPDASCPDLAEIVEGPTPTQGAGPLMLSPAAVEAFGADIDIQNVCASADLLAEEMRDIAAGLADERDIGFPGGLSSLATAASNGDSDAAQQVVAFWTEVMNRVTLAADPDVAACTMSEQGSSDTDQWVGSNIYTLWACELSAVPLQSVGNVTTDASGAIALTLLDQPAAVRRAIDEALAVSWAWSRWGGQTCDPAAEPAGVFPMPAALFNEYVPAELAGKDRCDHEANIRAAARAWAHYEQIQAELRGGGWAAAVGGWAPFAATGARVVGDSATAESFLRAGPWKPMQITSRCLDVMFFELQELAKRSTAFGGASASTVQGYITTPPDETTAAVIAADLASIVGPISTDPLCTQTRPYTDQEWLANVYTAYISDPVELTGESAEPITDPTRTGTETPVTDDGTSTSVQTRQRPPLSTNPDATATTGDKMAALAAHAGRLGAGAAVQLSAGTTAMVARLSPVKLLGMAAPRLERVGDGSDRGMDLVNIAVLYGGLYKGGEQPLLGGGMGLVGPPVPFADIFNSVGSQYGIDPRLLAAVAKLESNFNPEANCPDLGPAYGMMQLEGGAEVCGDTTRQVETAAEMLNGLYEAAGDWRGAIWGYNNGIGFAQKWRELGGSFEQASDFAVEFYCRNPERWASYTTDTQSGCEWRAGVAMKYISDEPGTRSGWLFYLEYQQLFPASVFSTGGPALNFPLDRDAPVELVKVENTTVNVMIASQVAAMFQAARAAGIELSAGGYRSYDSQVALRRAHCGTSYYAIYEMPASQCSPQTAPPGTSLHELGLALDVTWNGDYLQTRSSPAYLWLAANAASYGLYVSDVEPWHWSITGG